VRYTDPTGRDTNPIKGGKTADDYKVTGDFGSKYDANGDGTEEPHAGIDFVSKEHSIVATQKGKVIFAGEHPEGTKKATGTLIIIRYEDGTYGLYGHLSKDDLKVKTGDDVEEGAELGKYYTDGDGKMGQSGGPHLHYERYKLDDNKKDDKYNDINEFVKSFNGTGYFYGSKDVPNDKKIKDGFYAIKPGFDY
jgi:murein DD-endopeptidase MepM/ murein hydrolase activator NlpD